MRRADEKKVQIACYVDNELLKALDVQAEELDISRSALMSKLLKDRFQAKQTPKVKGSASQKVVVG